MNPLQTCQEIGYKCKQNTNVCHCRHPQSNSVVTGLPQCCQLYRVVRETPDYLPVSRLESEISWIIAKVCHFLKTHFPTRKFQIFCIVWDNLLLTSTFPHKRRYAIVILAIMWLVGSKRIRSNVTMPTTFFSRALCLRKFATIGVNVVFFAQMTSCAVRYHVVYHSFRINSEHLRTWRVDSPVTEWRSKLELELETCKRKMLAIQRGYMLAIMIICWNPTIFSWGLNCWEKGSGEVGHWKESSLIPWSTLTNLHS